MAAPLRMVKRMEVGAAKNVSKVYPRRSHLLRAALEYAAQGWPVFPCKPQGKTPLVADWPNRATTDQSRITAMWNANPNANIGIVTGERSGLLALDVDDPASLDELEAKHGELPATRTHATGSGGMHYLFRYPPGETIRNSAGKLGKGLDVRGEGGYIIAPPSRTMRPYEVLDELPLASPPAWMLKALRGTERGRRGKPSVRAGGDVTAALDGPPIPEGERNHTLAVLAGRLHDGTRTLEALSADLLEINAARCTPPLPDAEVERIAQSVYKLPPCKPSAPRPSPPTLEALAAIEADIRGRSWPGMGGKSVRDVCIALATKMRECGTLTPTGVRVSLSYAELAVLAGVSKRSLLDKKPKDGKRKPGIISRAKQMGVLRTDNAGRGVTEAGAFVLVIPPRAEVHHSPSATEDLKNPELTCGEPLRAPRLRWSEPEIRRLGKSRGQALDVLIAAGGELALADLERRMYPQKPEQKRRPRDVRRRILPPLEAAGVVECLGDTVRLTPGWREALERARLRGGEIAAETRDRERAKRHSRQRRERLAAPENERESIVIPPSEGERAACADLAEIRQGNHERRRAREERRKLRDVRELKRVKEPETPNGGLVEVVREGLEKNPHIHRESLRYRASWLSRWAWSENKVPQKPAIPDVQAALLALGQGAAA
jgi:bifunctional DNA primase/polymerase-like protein/primase-like protein